MYAFVWVRVLCTSRGCTVLYAFARVRVLCTSRGGTVLYAFVRVRVLCTSRGCTVLYAFVRVRGLWMYGFIRLCTGTGPRVLCPSTRMYGSVWVPVLCSGYGFSPRVNCTVCMHLGGPCCTAEHGHLGGLVAWLIHLLKQVLLVWEA